MLDGIENATYLEVERIEGTLLYLKGATFPFKGKPTEDAVQATNLFKTILKGHIPLLEIVNYVLEYDWAYRVRYIDLCNETTKEKLLKHPHREIKRLLTLNKQRDYLKVHKKLKTFSRLIILALYIPKYRKILKQTTLPSFDDIDLYWALQKKDYDIKGLTYQQRIEELERRGWKKVV